MHGRLEHVIAGVLALCGKVAVFPVGKEVIGCLSLLFHRLEIPKEYNGEGELTAKLRPAAQNGHAAFCKRRGWGSREGWKLAGFAVTTDVGCKVGLVGNGDV